MKPRCEYCRVDDPTSNGHRMGCPVYKREPKVLYNAMLDMVTALDESVQRHLKAQGK